MEILFNTFDNLSTFTPNMIPISISANPPDWFFKDDTDDGVAYYVNADGIFCGLQYEPLRLTVNYEEKIKVLDSARFLLLCNNTIILLKERLKFKKEGCIVLMHNIEEDIGLLQEYISKIY